MTPTPTNSIAVATAADGRRVVWLGGTEIVILGPAGGLRAAGTIHDRRASDVQRLLADLAARPGDLDAIERAYRVRSGS